MLVNKDVAASILLLLVQGYPDFQLLDGDELSTDDFEPAIEHLRDLGYINIHKKVITARGRSKYTLRITQEGIDYYHRNFRSDAAHDSKAHLSDRASLRKIIEQRLSKDDLESLCFDLGIDHEALRSATKSQMALDLIQWCARNGRLDHLASYVYSLVTGDKRD